ncbi:unnamed protein product [Symbiodinium sp. CCMP2592]|nr:unnamed protein product [Symbiodinium sp. CCMP2592]CAE7537652.1 unnamed protein product [Symbiodinium sp. CCMP2592]CAE7634108.1 unnamed protein product [Symbiodinium sp. CCMP2592]
MWPLSEKGKLRKASTDAMKLNKVEILETQINQDAHAIKSFLIAHKRLMERSDVQRDPDVQFLSDLYRGRLGDEGALAVYRHAHRPNHRRPAGPEDAPEEAEHEGDEEEEEDCQEGEDEEAAPIEDAGDDITGTEPEGDAVYEGPALPPWMGVEAIFDNPQEESDSDLEPPASAMGSEDRFGAELLSAPSVASFDPDSQDLTSGG